MKNISCEIPKNKLVVITGLSGSGKSSLAFDTIYAEGQRRYAESLSSYAKQFIDLQDKPDVDEIINLSPTITISGRTVSHNPRSTVGTMTEIYDYLRVLFARAGTLHCPKCGKAVTAKSKEEIVRQISSVVKNSAKSLILFPLSAPKTNIKQILKELQKNKFKKIRFNGKIVDIEDFIWQTPLEKSIPAEQGGAKENLVNLELVVGECSPNTDQTEIRRQTETALELGNGIAIVSQKNKDTYLSSRFFCDKCRVLIPNPEPSLFSFNNPRGACPKCTGLGVIQKFNPDLVIPNKKLTIAQGAIQPLVRLAGNQRYYMELLRLVGVKHGFSVDTPVKNLPQKAINIILCGTGEEVYLMGLKKLNFDGVIPHLEQRYLASDSDYLRKELENYMYTELCPECKGKRLNKEALSVTFDDKNISDFTNLPLVDHLLYWEKQKEKNAEAVAKTITKEITLRLKNLIDVNLGYLGLNRSAGTLSGGELQRVRLATQLNSGLSGVIYILDEPSIGLHPKDINKLIDALERLRNNQNTVLVVEHDAAVIKKADWIIDVGPGAGEYGGEIVAEGTVGQIGKNQKSLTGQYLSGSKKIQIICPFQTQKLKNKKTKKQTLVIKGAAANNLKNINVKIPLKQFVCVTGVSGSGKSTLILEILAAALRKKLHHAKEIPAEHKSILGMNLIDKVIIVDQSPIGRTPRSNPATYTGIFSLIRDFYAELPESKMRGYDAGKFSFNIKDGGRCLACGGEGYIQINMQFLPDMFVECKECRGRRYNSEVLEIHYKGKNIADILDMAVKEAREFFNDQPLVYEKLGVLEDVGLSYLHLGQPATKLSGGEAQRVKLATELGRRETGKTIYILDEPTTGLHFADINKLLNVLNLLVEKGNSVLVIEHNPDVVKCADWIIDLGPEGGEKGGYIVAEGSPRDVIKNKKSATGQYLRAVIS